MVNYSLEQTSLILFHSLQCCAARFQVSPPQVLFICSSHFSDGFPPLLFSSLKYQSIIVHTVLWSHQFRNKVLSMYIFSHIHPDKYVCNWRNTNMRVLSCLLRLVQHVFLYLNESVDNDIQAFWSTLIIMTC